MKRKITNLSILLILFSSQLSGQNWLGNTFSNYSGANGVYLNPSSIAESKYSYHLNVWGHGANIYNNYLVYNTPFGIRDWIQGDNTVYQNNNTGNIGFRQSWLSELNTTGEKQMSLTQDIRMPGFMFPVGPNANMSINLRQRSSAQAFGISAPFARVLRNGIDTNNAKLFGGNNPLKTNQLYDMGNFSSNIENYQELGITYAGNWSRTDKHTFNAGATLKLIRGIGGGYFNGKDGQFMINSSDSITLVGGSYDYGHTAFTNIRQPIENDYQLLYPSAGAGLGFDFGFTYLFNPNKSKYLKPVGCDENDIRNNYLLKVAAAVNDIGFINYDQAKSYTKTINTSGLSINHNLVGSFNNQAVDGFDTLDANTVNKLGFSSSSGYVSQLPTALNVSLDLRATKRFFVGLNWNQDLKKNSATGMRSTSYVALIPRFEFRGLEVSAPIVLGQNYTDLNLGLYARFGPFFIGSENLNGMLNKVSSSSYSGADIYGGMAIGIGHCPWTQDEEYNEEIVAFDTTSKQTRDSVFVVEKDTLIKKDLIEKPVYKTDTVYIEKLVAGEKVIEQITYRERQVAERERLVAIKETNNNCDICERNKRELERKIALLNKEIEAQKIRIAQLEKEVITNRNSTHRIDTVRIVDCGPKIYKDESGNTFDKCEYLERTNKSLVTKINRLEAEKTQLEADLNQCKIDKDNCCKKSSQEIEAERQRTEDILKREVEEKARKELLKKQQEEARQKAKEASKKATLEEEKRKAEIERIKKENDRTAQERARAEAELKRIAEEKARKKAEADRIKKEQERIVQERARAEAEQKRIAEEKARQAAAAKAAEEAAKKKAEEKAKKEAAQKAAEEKRKEEEEKKRKEDLK